MACSSFLCHVVFPSPRGPGGSLMLGGAEGARIDQLEPVLWPQRCFDR